MKAFKLQEYVAHSSNVNCLQIGRKSGQVLATGGEDRVVNMWRIGRHSNIMSLSGHSSSVECVAFDANEESVAAGSQGGSVKIFNLAEGKVSRTLSGHMSTCTCVDFHPYGEFLASGSMDTNLKVWDIRHKSCIQTYKGHNKQINDVSFSPDGRWVISGSKDGAVKLWDLTAGKLLHDFSAHTASITALRFNQNEFLLATASADRTVKFWDLETFELICGTPPDTTPVRSIAFAADGQTVLAAGQANMKVWSWEPVILNDTVEVGWDGVADLHVSLENQLIACSYESSFVSIWIVELDNVQSAPQFADESKSDHSLSSTTTEAKATRSSATSTATSSTGEGGTPDYEAKEDVHAATGRDRTAGRPLAGSEPDQYKPTHKDRSYQTTAELPAFKDDAYARVHESKKPEPKAEGTLVPSHRDEAVGLDFQQFIPDATVTTARNIARDGEIIEDMLDGSGMFGVVLQKKLTELRVVRRFWTDGDVKGAISHLIQLREPTASPVAADFLRAVSLRSEAFNLDSCALLLPFLCRLLATKYEDYLLVAVQSIHSLFNTFGDVIDDTRRLHRGHGSESTRGPVDLNREERTKKCMVCHKSLVEVQEALVILHSERRAGEAGTVIGTLKHDLEDYLCS